MVTYLNCLLMGAEGTGKTALAQALSNGRSVSGVYEAAVTDPNTRQKLVFRLEEGVEEERWREAVCALVLYDVRREDSYLSATTDIIPSVLRQLPPDRSFVMLVGTHPDPPCPRFMPAHEAEDYAATHALLHLEVSPPLRKNVELTLKVMRIRTVSLLKRFPEVGRNREKRLEIDFGSLGEDRRENPTPQFSERNAEEKRHSFDAGRPRADPSTSETNLSFTNMSHISSDEDCPSSRSSLNPMSESVSELPSRSEAETERRAERYRESLGGRVTERQRGRDIAMSVEVVLGVEGTVTVPIYADDSSLDVAQRCLGGLASCPGLSESLACLIETKVQEYCQEVRSVRRQEEKVLFRVKVNIGAHPRDIIVREGSDLPSLSLSFAQENGLAPELQGQVLALLKRAYQQYCDRRAGGR